LLQRSVCVCCSCSVAPFCSVLFCFCSVLSFGSVGVDPCADLLFLISRSLFSVCRQYDEQIRELNGMLAKEGERVVWLLFPLLPFSCLFLVLCYWCVVFLNEGYSPHPVSLFFRVSFSLNLEKV
jgi:hypothetical protein